MTTFVDQLHEVFADFGPVRAKKMFGGWGIYHAGLMFALVVDETLYLKADAGNLDAFTAMGLGPFVHRRKDRVMEMPYYRAPDGIIDDREQAAHWARQSFAAAERAATATLRPKPTPKPKPAAATESAAPPRRRSKQ